MNNTAEINSVAVVGLGLLGRGIAACFLGHGFKVVAVEPDPQCRAEARRNIGQMIEELVEIGGFNPGLRSEWSNRFVATADVSALSECQFVVESIVEDAVAKEAVFDQIESRVSAETVIASNSSAIPISQLQSTRRHPDRFVAMHWAEPAHATRFMEIIRGGKTSDRAVQATKALAKKLGKEPSLLEKEIPGFIVNRIGYAMYREALSLLEAGVADVETIDRSMRNALGLWATLCGPFRWVDITGGPELYARAIERVLPTLNNSQELPAIMKKLAESGARGTINGRGFYRYTPEEARHWEELYRRHAWRVSQMQNEYFPSPDEQRS